MAIIRLQGEDEKRRNIYYEVDTSEPAIGEGGMGKVVRGVCVNMMTNVSRPVAIKFLYEDLPSHAIERARREASIQLRNDNLVEMLGFVETQTGSGDSMRKHYHVVSELLHGVSLSEILDGKCTDSKGVVIPYAQKLLADYQADPSHFAKTIVLNVLSGLVALHDAGYVHRDIDPSNIMVTDDGHIKLIDFGIAKQVNKLTTNDRGLTTAGMFMGKAEYAAPELALGDLKHQNQTTDIYAMGILLFQCIVGHVPFEGPTNIVLEKQVKKDLPLSLVKDKGLRRVIACATDKNQTVRYQTASQMRVAMENMDGLKMQMRKSKKITIIAVAILGMVMVSTLFGLIIHRENVHRETAQQAEQTMNDSLRSQMVQLQADAEAAMQLGDKHDEGYEQAYIEAYVKFSQALDLSETITDNVPEKGKVKQERDKVRQALGKAKSEFDEKARDFEQEGMADVAQEFLQRSKSISNILNKE